VKSRRDGKKTAQHVSAGLAAEAEEKPHPKVVVLDISMLVMGGIDKS